MTRKVMTLDDGKRSLFCTYDNSDKFNPYRLYVKWFDGRWHRKMIVKYADMSSVVHYIADYLIDR